MRPDLLPYLLVMAGVTYLIRVLPLLLIRKPIRNRFVRSFLFYVPYATLAVMTFPAILYATYSLWSGLAGLLVAMLLAWNGKGLFNVSAGACVVVFLMELFL